LKNGRIVKEQYWNNWTPDTRYYIASAGKSVVAFLTGIAQDEGILNINNPTSTYLGQGWTTLPLIKENAITVKNQLSMNSGLDDGVADSDCTDSACLIFKANAGTRWAYHNAPYLLLHDVIANASGTGFGNYAKTRLFDKIGMNNPFWNNGILFCTTRDASRFGSLMINKGIWKQDTLLKNSEYFESMINSSQNLNPSYGYLWWLNGKSKFMAPTLQTVFNSSLVPEGPSDMYMALGKEDKKIYVVPSLGIVAVRLGDAAEAVTLGPSSFDNEFWRRMKLAIRY
jgi:CubicO group peptidase (beta-lactamase class C family)